MTVASSIYFNGRVISVPGSYSEVDASGLETVGLGASGIVAVLGTAEGGAPVSAMSEASEVLRFTSPEKMNKAFRAGQLREVGNMLFAPAKDPDILAGAQEVVAMKVNPATQSTGSLLASGLPQIDLVSRDYGAFTTGINVEVQDGSSQGKMLTIRHETSVETVDNLGGSALATLQYSGGSYGYTTATMSVTDAGDLTVNATRTSAGKDADITNPVTASTVEVVSTNQTGTAPVVGTPSAANVVTISSLSGMTAAHVGRTITFAGAANSGNNGTFTIVSVPGTTSVTIVNASAVAETGGGGFSWTVSDAGIKVTLYGLVGGLPVKETVTCTGTVAAAGSLVWDAAKLLGVVLDKTPVAGTMVVRIASAGDTVFSIPVGSLSKGVAVCQYFYVDSSTVSLALSTSGAYDVLLFGSNAAGASVKEKLTTNGTSTVTSVASTFAQLEAVVVSGIPAAKTLTVSVRAARTTVAVQGTLLKVSDYFATKQTIISSSVTMGFTFTLLTGNLKFSVADLDIVSNRNVNTPATGSLTGDLYAIVAWINQNSQLVSATTSVGAVTVPDNTLAPQFLTGGVEGVALFSHYQAALNLLKKVRVNTVVDLSGDPAVAAAVDAHCAYMCGIGRSERDATVGLLNDAGDDVPTKVQIKSQIVDLNSRHIRAFGQAIQRYNSAGERAEFLPPYLGAIAAGMQAGSPVGTSLTFKYANVLGYRNHSTWNPTDDAEELITAGLCFLENKEGVGRRFVRNITTHLSSNNLAYVEGSVNNAVNYAVFNFRTNMEFAVGKRGFAGTLAAARGVAIGTLGLLTDNTVITAYRALFLELITDVLDVSVELAPVIPINFVKTTVHLVTIAQAA